ncbi:ankyrin repeat domain-containing protein [Neorhizobium galegae]|uniref:Ankyrin repeat domain-containing protein n=1 Tax=Neorhizobium galegae TaxID=399 RepID=A0A6A1TLA8_NEOGA|nr:ankyrin repeat domain-containing protein [Neorhizobium galegae]KAB1085060.1 ankyrin repeat domain-containing protein [Neorhizobium galegae]
MASEPRPPAGSGEDPHTAFLAAVNIGDIDRVRRFLGNRAIDINYAEPGTGLTALHIAAARNAGAVMRLLVGTGKCDFKKKDADGRTAATVAVIIGRNPATGRFLFDLQYGSGVAGPRPGRRRPLAGSQSG